MSDLGLIEKMRDAEIDAELREIEDRWDTMIVGGQIEAAQTLFGERFQALLAERNERKMHSAPAVVRLRFLAGENSRRLDAAAAEALGWRVDKDPWWNWHEGPIFDPPGDEWCIRKDGRNDLPCNEALPHFTAELFEQAVRSLPSPRSEGA